MKSSVDSYQVRLSWIQAIAVTSVRCPRLVLSIWSLALLISAIGVVHLEIDTATSTFLERQDSAWEFYQYSLSQFGGDEFVCVVIDGDAPFDPEVLNNTFRLSKAFEMITGVRRVDSIATFPSLISTSGGSLRLGPIMRRLLERGESTKEIAIAIKKDRIVNANLVSADGRSFAINIFFSENVDDSRSRIVEDIRRVIGGMRVWYSGVPVFRTEVNTRTARELAMFVPVTLLLMVAVMLIGFRSLPASWVAVTCSAIGTWIVIGAMGAIGAPISLSTVTLPPVLLAVGCAYVTHMIEAIRGCNGEAALDTAIQKVSGPVGLSGLTTALGFLAMVSVPIRAIRDLGSFGALGVLLVLFSSLTIPPALARLRVLVLCGERPYQFYEDRISNWLLVVFLKRRVSVVLCWLSLGVISGMSISQIKIDTDIIRWFSRETPVRMSYEAIRERIAGITPLNAVIEARDGHHVTDPMALEKIDAFGGYIMSLSGVGSVVSIVDVIRQMHIQIGSEADEEIPKKRALIEQYLALLGSGEYIRSLISDDREMANVLVRSNLNGSSQIMQLADDIEEWWRRNGLDGYEVDVTGIMYEFGRAEEAIAYGQIRGLLSALFAIGLILFVLLRNFRGVCASIVPNVLPIVIVYGALGLVGIPLDAATVCVGCIALGIAVDDTIHIATGYHDGLLLGLQPDQALRGALVRVLFPLCVSTVAVASGFLVLSISEFVLIQHFGLVTAVVVVLCLVADLTLLPILLGFAMPRPGRGKFWGCRYSRPGC